MKRKQNMKGNDKHKTNKTGQQKARIPTRKAIHRKEMKGKDRKTNQNTRKIKHVKDMSRKTYKTRTSKNEIIERYRTNT